MKKQNTKHTPGPWGILDLEDGELEIVDDSENDLAQITDQIVATVRNGSNTKENARLIAAAPELLDACQWMFDILKNATQVRGKCLIIEITDSDSAEENYDMLLKMLGEAIVKAEKGEK